MREQAAKHAIACVDIPSLALQVLRRDHPEWTGLPMAVVAEDKPQALVLSVSKTAQKSGIRAGMRFSAALGLERNLRAAPVDRKRVEEVRAELIGAFHRFSPKVAPDPHHDGVFFLDPSGLVSLFGSRERWCELLFAELAAHNLTGAVVVGFARWPCWAVARTSRSARVLESPAEERRLAEEVSLLRLELPPASLEALTTLGIRTLKEFLSLPRGEISVRFGAEAKRLHAELSGALEAPLDNAPWETPFVVSAEVDPPDDDLARLLFCMKGAMHVLVDSVAKKNMALSALHFTLHLERGAGLVSRPPIEQTLRLARTSRDEVSVLELLRLRLGALELPAKVTSLDMRAESSPLEGTQLLLTTGTRARDPDAIQRGIARLRAAFGDDAVTVPELDDNWAPERSFHWARADVVHPPRRIDRDEAVQRRLLSEPRALPTDARGWPMLSPRLSRLVGPYRIQSGWWVERDSSTGALIRDYFFGECENGSWLWLFRDLATTHWFLHALVD